MNKSQQLLLNSEQSMDIGFIKNILSENFEINKIEIRHNSNTYNSFAYEIDDAIIVRFPCREAARDKLVKEHHVLTFLKGKTSLQIPDTHLNEIPYLYAWHQKIKGDNLTQEELSSWDKDKKNIFCRDIAKFIYELNVNTDTISNEIELPLWQKYEKMDNVDKIIGFYLNNPNFTKEELEFINKFLTTFNLNHENEKIKFCHFDIMGKNLAVNKQHQKLIGIYDFGECALGDIHKEFSQIALNFDCNTIRNIINEYKNIAKTPINIKQVEGYAFYTWLEFCYRYNCSEFGICGVRNKIQDIKMTKGLYDF